MFIGASNNDDGEKRCSQYEECMETCFSSRDVLEKDENIVELCPHPRSMPLMSPISIDWGRIDGEGSMDVDALS